MILAFFSLTSPPSSGCSTTFFFGFLLPESSLGSYSAKSCYFLSTRFPQYSFSLSPYGSGIDPSFAKLYLHRLLTPALYRGYSPGCVNDLEDSETFDIEYEDAFSKNFSLFIILLAARLSSPDVYLFLGALIFPSLFLHLQKSQNEY